MDKDKKKVDAARKKRVRQAAKDKAAMPKPEKKKELTIEQRLDRLEFIAAKMAHFSGNNRILIEAGLEIWAPQKKDMHRFVDNKKDGE